MKTYRYVSVVLMLLFAVTGLLFLFVPSRVLALFDHFSPSLGMPQCPVKGLNFYVILAVGYMYLVTVLAFFMYRHPDNKIYPQLLAHAKIASSVLSLALFLLNIHYLIFLVNFLIDGFIGAFVITLYFKKGKVVPWVYS
jgi:hypothetical protein